MVAIIREARFIKKGEPTGAPIRFRFASKWKIIKPKAREDLFMLYGVEGQFICSVTSKLLNKARKEDRIAHTNKQDKGSKQSKEGIRGHQLTLGLD